MSTTNAERLKAYRERKRLGTVGTVKLGRPPEGKPKFQRQRKPETNRQRKLRPFVGCDGEGGGRDRMGRQHYKLFRMGERELFANNRPLRTREILEFILAAPKGPIYVGFGIGYDVTQILRDVPPERLKLLLDGKETEDEEAPEYEYTAWGVYDLAWRPGHYFKVRRLYEERDERKNPHRPVPGSTRTLFEVRGNFQSSFVGALDMFEIGSPALRNRIHADKQRRDRFTRMTNRIREYNRLECELLAQLMEKFRAVCHAAPGGGIKPTTWNGAGKLAEALLRRENIPRLWAQHKQDTPLKGGTKFKLIYPPIGLMPYAWAAYYGGRFELFATGKYEGPVWQYDISSAYPSALRKMPCLIHGKWRRLEYHEAPPPGAHALCEIKHAQWLHEPMICGLPHRDASDGGISFQERGKGVYWWCEIESAMTLGPGVMVEHQSGWVFETSCDCDPFRFVEELYEYRRQLGGGFAGYPIKLALNSIYGKLVQKIGGGGPFTNHLWGSLVSARIRAELNRAAALDPEAVLMMATDAIYTTRELPLPTGKYLGGWEPTELDGIFLLQPGIYWELGGKGKVKSRGLPPMAFEPYRRKFERNWSRWVASDPQGEAGVASLLKASVNIAIRNFIGWRLALHRSEPNLAGKWLDEMREISFSWGSKRQGWFLEGELARTFPRPGLDEAGEPLRSCDYVFDERLKAAGIEIGGDAKWQELDMNFLDEANPD